MAQVRSKPKILNMVGTATQKIQFTHSFTIHTSSRKFTRNSTNSSGSILDVEPNPTPSSSSSTTSSPTRAVKRPSTSGVFSENNDLDGYGTNDSVRDPDYKENERPTKTSRFALSDSEDTSGDENVHVNAISQNASYDFKRMPL
jgi:hypothetical protein